MVAAARKALEGLYSGRCSLLVRESRKDPVTKITGQEEVTLLEGIHCRLSYKAVPTAGIPSPASPVVQAVKVFLAPEVEVPPGSKLVITQEGHTAAYTGSGQPARYATHQEIPLELFRGWA